jgi:predicted transcriptional regulator
MSSKNRVTVNLSDDEFAALGALAEQSRVSKAWIGRQAISTLLERTRRSDEQMPLPLAQVRGGRR